MRPACSRFCPHAAQDLDERFYTQGKRWIVDVHLMPDGTGSRALAALDALRDAYACLDFYREDWGVLQRLQRAIKWLLADHASTWDAWARVDDLFWHRMTAAPEPVPWRLHAPDSAAPEPSDAYMRRWLLELPIEALVHLCGTLASHGMLVVL